MTTKPVWTYLLQDPFTLDIRYVGKALNPQHRYWQHCRLYEHESRTRKYRWIKRLMAQGAKPILTGLVKWPNNTAACVEGKRLIAYFRSIGVNITNHTDGGEGALGFKQPPEVVKRSADAKRGKPISEQGRSNMRAAYLAMTPEARRQRALLGASHISVEDRERISKAGNNAIKSNPDVRAKMSASAKASYEWRRANGGIAPISEETRARLCVAAKERADLRREQGFVVSGEARRNISKAMRARSDETLAKVKAASQTPEFRQKCSERLKDEWTKRRASGDVHHLIKTRAKIAAAHQARNATLKAERAKLPPEQILCACACNTLMNARGPKGYKRTYIRGHQNNNRVLTAEDKDTLRAAMTKLRNDPIVEAKRIERLKAKLADPAFQEKRIAAVKAAHERKRENKQTPCEQLALPL